MHVEAVLNVLDSPQAARKRLHLYAETKSIPEQFIKNFNSLGFFYSPFHSGVLWGDAKNGWGTNQLWITTAPAYVPPTNSHALLSAGCVLGTAPKSIFVALFL